jgi:hypothetical protein
MRFGAFEPSVIGLHGEVSVASINCSSRATVFAKNGEIRGNRRACKTQENSSMEQFFLTACVDFDRHHPDSPFRGVRVKYLFPSWDAAYNPNYAAKAGFTHLLGDAKSKPAVGKRLEERVKRDDPAYFHRCERIIGRTS